MVERRFFEFLYAEFSVAIDRRISRYDLWLRVSEAAIDPSHLPRDEKQRFIDQCLDSVLAHERKDLAPRARQRLLRRLLSFDPRYPTPEECLTRLAGAPS